MKNVSSEFLQTMEKRRDFTCYAEVTLLDGTALTLTADDFTVDNNSIVESSGDSGIPLGVAICKTIQIELANRDEKFSHYDFFGAKIVFKTKFELSETTEAIEEGIFTVLDPYTYGETIIITALDNMYKANTYYATELNFPATLKDMLQDICSTYDIPLGTTTFLNDDFVIDARPEGNYIVRNLIGYIAMIAGGNARINRYGELEIVSYDFSVMDAILDGGTFEPWTTGDTVDGGTMEPWSEGEEVSGGSYVGLQPYHILKNFSELKVDTDDVIITGVQMEVETEEGTAELLVGEKGYVLQVENPLISGKEQEALELIGAVLIGGQMRRFEGTHIAYPLAEFMDGCIVVDRKGNAYPTILTDVNFVYFDFTTLKNAAESPTAKGINYSSGYTKAIIEAKKLVEKEKSDRELAVGQLESKLTNASGLYVTPEEQEDGSIIYYMHDKPTLEESQIVWKYTSQAFGVSTDGGVNYPYGFSATGETIAKLLYAEGINADYITTGIIKDATGKNYWNLATGEFVTGNGKFSGNITVGGADNSYGLIRVLDSDGVARITVDKDSITWFTDEVFMLSSANGLSWYARAYDDRAEYLSHIGWDGIYLNTGNIETYGSLVAHSSLAVDGAATIGGALKIGSAHTLDLYGNVWSNGSFVSYTPNCFVSYYGGHNMFFRNDGSDFYILHKANSTVDTSWDGLRPFAIKLATGLVTMGNGLTVGGVATFNGRVDATYGIRMSHGIGITGLTSAGNPYWMLGLEMRNSGTTSDAVNCIRLGHTALRTYVYTSSDGQKVYSNGSWYQFSDERLKKDFLALDDRYLEAFDNFEPCYFTWVEGGAKQIGYKAQQILAAMTAAGISEDENTVVDLSNEYVDFEAHCKGTVEYYALGYESIDVIANYALQDARKRLKSLEEVVVTLKTEIYNLKQSVQKAGLD